MAVLYLLLLGLILYGVYFLVGKFLQGNGLLIVGAILIVIWLIYLVSYFLPGLGHPVLTR